MSNEFNVPRDFKGIWIPREIWLHPELLPLEKLVWAEIHSLYNREKGGCYAKNDYLSRFFGVGETYISKVISKLKKLGFVEEVHFNGRQRVIKAVLPPEDFGQCKADLHYSATQTCSVEQGRLEPQCNPPIYIENKEKNKDNNTPLPPKGKAPIGAGGSSNSSSSHQKKKQEADPPDKNSYRDNVSLTEKQYANLLELYGEVKLKAMLDYLDAYKGSKGINYKSDYHVLLPANWLNKRYEEEKEKRKTSGGNHGNNAKGDARKRQMDSWVENNGDPNDNPNILRFD